MTKVANLERRRIQGEIVKPIYDELVAEIGKDAAQALLARAVRTSLRQEAKQAAAALGETGVSMEAFAASFRATYLDRGPEAGLDVELLRADENHLDFNVTRCRFVEVYREMGLGELAPVLSCNRDGAFATDFDANIRLERAQTIAEGAPCCTFRYTYERSDTRGDGEGENDG